MYNLKDKVVLITGAAKGIGVAIAREVLEEGAKHVRILDIDVEAGEQIQDEFNSEYGAKKSMFVKCDVTNEAQLFTAIKSTKDEKGYVDVVINNAAVTNEFDYAAIQKLIEVNYVAVLKGTLKAMEYMDKTKGGKGGTVINICSAAGLFPICVPLFTYSSTKSAIIQFTSCIGSEIFYKKTGVRTLSICFGATDTTIFDNITTFEGRDAQAMLELIAQYPKQSAKSAAQGVIDAYKNGESASVWMVVDNKPGLDITPKLKKHHEDMLKLLTS